MGNQAHSLYKGDYMNTFTKKIEFVQDAQFILDNSTLLIKEDCVIHNNVLYERLGTHEHSYRFFFQCEDYDYLVDNPELVAELNTRYK